jgi:hypothetical protein
MSGYLATLRVLVAHKDVTYDDVKDRTIELDIGDVRVLVLEMSRLIEAKQAAGRPKDIAVLPVLQATLAEIRKDRSTKR